MKPEVRPRAAYCRRNQSPAATSPQQSILSNILSSIGCFNLRSYLFTPDDPRVLCSVLSRALAVATKRPGFTTHDMILLFQSFAEALHHLLRRLARARASRWATTCGCHGTFSTASARSTTWRPPSTPSPSPATGTVHRCRAVMSHGLSTDDETDCQLKRSQVYVADSI